MQIRFVNLITFLIVLMVGNQTASSQNYQSIASNTAILKTTLATLDIQNPEKDIDRNMRNQDLRFICLCGYACYTPGVNEQDISLTKKYGIKCLEGTSDMIEGDEHKKLIEAARNYADKYNVILLRKINEKEKISP